MLCMGTPGLAIGHRDAGAHVRGGLGWVEIASRAALTFQKKAAASLTVLVPDKTWFCWVLYWPALPTVW